MENQRETFTTKEALLNHGIKSKLFYFRAVSDSYKRGFNRTILLYVLDKELKPICIGEEHINTASYKGDKATASNFIASMFNYKTDGYNLLDLKIKLYEL